jgi:hypothetical protein
MLIGIHYSESFSLEEIACFRVALGNPRMDFLETIRTMQEHMKEQGRVATLRMISEGRIEYNRIKK